MNKMELGELIEVKDIKAKKGMTVDELIRMMGASGGFTAQKLADSVDVVEKMVNDLMVERREEFQRAVDKYRILAIKSVSEGGSSYSNLDCFIQDIHKMNDKRPRNPCMQ